MWQWFAAGAVVVAVVAFLLTRDDASTSTPVAGTGPTSTATAAPTESPRPPVDVKAAMLSGDDLGADWVPEEKFCAYPAAPDDPESCPGPPEEEICNDETLPPAPAAVAYRIAGNRAVVGMGLQLTVRTYRTSAEASSALAAIRTAVAGPCASFGDTEKTTYRPLVLAGAAGADDVVARVTQEQFDDDDSVTDHAYLVVDRVLVHLALWGRDHTALPDTTELDRLVRAARSRAGRAQ